MHIGEKVLTCHLHRRFVHYVLPHLTRRVLKKMKKQDSFLQSMEFHINAFVRNVCQFDKTLFSSTGNVVISDITDIHQFVHTFNLAVKDGKFDKVGNTVSYLKSGLLNGMGILDEVFHAVCRLYRRDINKDFFTSAYEYINKALLQKSKSATPLDDLLLTFITEFPPYPVYTKQQGLREWLSSYDSVSNMPHTIIALEELLLLRLANENGAFEPFFVLFNDEALRESKQYSLFWRSFKEFSSIQAPFGPEHTDLISMLKKPVEYAPYSIKGQIEYVIRHWKDFLGDWLQLLLSGLDLIAEEEKQGWISHTGPIETSVYNFDNILDEYEKFSHDYDWMPNVILIAKSSLVWLNQLSKKYSRNISRLDEIPDEEIKMLADYGFNALWLIGIWERSRASARIKQLCGNPEAASSAYSLHSYEIAEELGGWQALENLRTRCTRYNIKLAADMVPNHTGMDSRWIVERPHLFLSTNAPPFPSYSFSGQNLSTDSRVEVYLEDHYFSREDCAVVFKRRDNLTGSEMYIYHGNDGTGLPWNDTAQLDFLNPETREAVIQEILNVAKNFKIIRLDAAMVLAKKHIQRLWYPQLGSGGTIATRSRFAMTNEQFNEKIPVEFWREVVDRCNQEAPDTLLLAEAFWMMEGYFVRTLGMHRVYNSAFMNMLKMEENEKYRNTIKNTLTFDPQVLKRYVNFMNNPDEDTAIAQFGSSDKYFGICTMMVTMPGLPMFGHGQIEGLEEKYGMEYRRAYYEEVPKQELIERHEREIFPLMRRRSFFSGVENFFLFDFWNNGLVNENVFAWSNCCAGNRSLIFYNNAYERAFGWILLSAGYAVKQSNGEKIIEQKSFLSALQLTNAENYFTIFHEQRSGLYYIRENCELARSGFYAALDGFQCQVFWEIYEVKDTETSLYRTLCTNLDGAGFESIDEYIRCQELEQLHTSLYSLLDEQYFIALKTLSEQRSQNLKHTISTKDILVAIKHKLKHFVESIFSELQKQNPEKEASFTPDIQDAVFMYVYNRLEVFLHFLGLPLDTDTGTPLEPQMDFLSLIQKTFFTSYEDIFIFGAGLFFLTIKSAIKQLALDDEPAQVCKYWLLDKKITQILAEYGVRSDIAFEKLQLIEHFLALDTVVFSETNRKTSAKKTKHKNLVVSAIELWCDCPVCTDFLHVHDWQDSHWFNKEQSEYLALVTSFFTLLETKPSQTSYLKAVQYANAVYADLTELIAQSAYRLEALKLACEDL